MTKINKKFETVYETLSPTIKKNGFNYTFVERGNKALLYQQQITESLFYYEVLQIKVRPEREFKGKTFPAKEQFPYNEAFGKWTWTFRNLEEANKRFLELETFNTPM